MVPSGLAASPGDTEHSAAVEGTEEVKTEEVLVADTVVVAAAAVFAAAVAVNVPAVGSGQSRESPLDARPSSAAAIANAGAEEAGSREEEGNGPARAVGSEGTAYAVAEEHS